MTRSLLMLQGLSQETMPFDATCKAHLHNLAHNALPILALQLAPLPTLCLSIERKRDVSLNALLHTLFSHESKAFLSLTWNTFFVSDGSSGESFLFLTCPSACSSSVSIRFNHFRHLPLLQAMAQTGNMAIVDERYTQPAIFSSNPTELRKHLHAIRHLQLA